MNNTFRNFALWAIIGLLLIVTIALPIIARRIKHARKA